MNKYVKKIKTFVSIIVYNLMLSFLFKNEKKACKDNIESEGMVVVFLAALGDFVVFCEVAKYLFTQGEKITLICRKDSGIEEFAAMTPYYKDVIALDNKFLERIKNIRVLNNVNAKVAFSAPMGRHALSDIYTLAINANKRIVADTEQSITSLKLKQRLDSYFDKRVPIQAINELDRYKEYLSGMGYSLNQLQPYILENDCFTTKVKNESIAIFLGASGSSLKIWPYENFAWVANEIHNQYNVNVYLMGTIKEKTLADKVCELLGHEKWAINKCGETSIQDTLEIIHSCKLVLANDTGSAHLSVSCNTPTVIIAGGWEYGRFYPNRYLPDSHKVVIGDETLLQCWNCGESKPTCEKNQVAKCIMLVKKECVLRTINDMFENL